MRLRRGVIRIRRTMKTKLHSNMRIIAGLAKGRPLVCIEGDNVRPTPERMRHALFNILGESLVEAEILDLFSGTGSLGLEALSRGAKQCVFVEKGFGALQALRKNISELGFDNQVTVLAQDVFGVDVRLAQLGQRYDLIFAAPPYAMLENRGNAQRLFDQFARVAENFGKEEVNLSLQHSPQSHVPEVAGELRRFDHRRYGYAELSRFCLERDIGDGSEGNISARDS